MVKKALLALLALGVSVALVIYVYPIHPYVVWALLGIAWACYRLSLRAKSLFGARMSRSTRVDESIPHPLLKNSRNPGEPTLS